MLRLYTVSFFGHRIIEDFNRAEAKAESLSAILFYKKDMWSSWSGAAGISTSRAARWKGVLTNAGTDERSSHVAQKG